VAARATWKGVLSLGIINVPVGAIATAESAARISFNQLHKTCRARVKQQKVCSSCEAKLENDDIVKGYEFAKDQYVVVPDEELGKLKVESDRQIRLEAFVNDAVDPVTVDKTYYLVPDGKLIGPFHVIQKALGDRIGIGKISLQGREQQVAIQARGRGFLMYTITPFNEVRSIADLIEDAPAVNPQEVELAKMLIDRLEVEDFDLSEHQDAYKEGVRKIIDALIRGEEITVAAPQEAPKASSGNMLEMLKASLAAVPSAKPAKAKLPAAQPEELVAAAPAKAARRRKTA
jgi:DNA end-binding protein Ku